MNMPRIEALDLRPPPAPADPWAVVWDWPELPSFLKRRVIQTIITLDTSRFMAALAEAQANVDRLMFVFNPPPWYRRFYTWEWMLYGGLAMSVVTTIGVLVDAWL